MNSTGLLLCFLGSAAIAFAGPVTFVQTTVTGPYGNVAACTNSVAGTASAYFACGPVSVPQDRGASDALVSAMADQRGLHVTAEAEGGNGVVWNLSSAGASGIAHLDDTININWDPNVTGTYVGTLRLLIGLDGGFVTSLDGNVDDTGGEAGGTVSLSFDAGGHIGSGSCNLAFASYDANPTRTCDVSFRVTYADAVSFTMQLNASAGIAAPTVGNAFALAQFGDTAKLSGIQLSDLGGNPIGGASFLSSNGFDYLAAAQSAPEPGPAVMLAGGAALIALRFVRRKA